MEERSVLRNAFDLIFAFDEAVSRGYREKVTLAQIRTYTEMDSQEERIHDMIEKVILLLSTLVYVDIVP